MPADRQELPEGWRSTPPPAPRTRWRLTTGCCRPTGAGRLACQAQDLHPSGACGDATNADAERGRRLVEHAAQALVSLLEEVDRHPLANLRHGPTDA
jgi:creatinine amidohydrolase/Fe(II)-dependent formamide hydrolase-like protein